jgi:DNA repair exonuclease SbcCD ATPase subunit
MGLFGGGGKSRDQMIAEAAELNVQQAVEEKKEDATTGNAKIDIEFAKIKGQLDSFAEVRKATTERFSRISEQMGELRGMIIDTNKAMGKVEVSSTKAIDLVESVHPEKLMIEVRKQDGKIEALRANIESNEAIMKDLMLELKKMRDRMNFYKGVEQVIAMNEEIKQELATIKRVEANVERHADKIETVFIEVEKKFTEFEKFNDAVKDLDKQQKKIASDFEKIRVKVELKLERKDFLDLLDKFNDFEKHTTNLLKLLDERNKTIKQEIDAEFKNLEIEYRKKLDAMRPPSKPAPLPKEAIAQLNPAAPGEAQANSQSGAQAGGQAAQSGEAQSAAPSGEDGAGGDNAKPGFFSKIFKKKE